MRKFSRLLSLSLVILMIFALAACNNGGATGTTTTPPAATKAPATTTPAGGAATQAPTEPEPELEFYNISVYFPMHASASLETMPASGKWMVDLMYEEMFNVEFDFTYVPSTSQTEVYNVTMASRDIPDIVLQGNWTNLHNYKEAWWPLNDFIIGKQEYLEEYFFNDSYAYAVHMEQDGQVKILSMLSDQYIGDVLLVRGDLVEEWGIDMSQYKTKEDFYDLLSLVKQKDSKVMPFMIRMNTSQPEALINRLTEGFTGLRMLLMVDTDGLVKYGAAEPGMREAVEWLNKLYTEGLIDQEFTNTGTPQWQEQLLNNGIFLTHDNASSRIRWAINEWANLGVTGPYYEAIPPIQPDENTNGFTTIHYPRQRNCMAVFIGAVEGKVERIMDMMNYSFSPEGSMLLAYGIEGESFYYEADGTIFMIPEYQAGRDANDPAILPYEAYVKGSVAEFGRLEPNGIYSPNNRDIPAIQEAAAMYEDGGLIRRNYLDAIRFTDEEQATINSIKEDLETYTKENITQFIMGTKPMDQWDSFVEGLERVHLSEYLKINNDAFGRARIYLGDLF